MVDAGALETVVEMLMVPRRGKALLFGIQILSSAVVVVIVFPCTLLPEWYFVVR
jgi:hypothetical protein